MTLNDDELRFLTKALRTRNRRPYLVWWGFAAAAFGMFLWILSNMMRQESLDFLLLSTQSFLIGIGLMASIFGLLELTYANHRRRVLALLLRFINRDPEALEQLSAKHGLGDLGQ